MAATEKPVVCPANLFAKSGKWKYSVVLDYTDLVAGPVDETGFAPFKKFMNAGDAAEIALAAATDKGISGVTIREIGDYYILVVTDPPNGFPVLVTR